MYKTPKDSTLSHPNERKWICINVNSKHWCCILYWKLSLATVMRVTYPTARQKKKKNNVAMPEYKYCRDYGVSQKCPGETNGTKQ